MKPETRQTYRKTSSERTKALHKLRIQKSLTDQTFSDFYTIPQRVQIDDVYVTCMYRTGKYRGDCNTCQYCGFIYLS
jgi:hypothetical protein